METEVITTEEENVSVETADVEEGAMNGHSIQDTRAGLNDDEQPEGSSENARLPAMVRFEEPMNRRRGTINANPRDPSQENVSEVVDGL